MTENLSKDTRLEQIINAAAQEFLEQGYENSSMERIAKRAGLTKGGLYHHFSSKDEIMLAATQKFAEPMIVMMNEAAALPSAKEALLFILYRYLSFWNEHRTELAFYFLTMVKASYLPALAKMYEGYFNQLFDYYKELFDQGVAQKEFRAHDTSARATVLLAALDGAVGYLLIDRQADVEYFIEQMKKLFINEIIINPR
jgi:AcrR family transcriptional regulator